jgi:hypothetical protein
MTQQSQNVLKYARDLAEQLDQDMNADDTYSGRPFWQADKNPDAQARIAARSVAALDFLRQYAGADSAWTHRAIGTYESKDRGETEAHRARDLGHMLRLWAEQVEAGITEIAGTREWAEVGTVSTDVMGQVRRLLDDRAAHPAAPIVLCGAALEISRRAVATAHNVPLPAKPAMNTLVAALRSAQLLTAQDEKDFLSVAGLRNQAAHGQFDALSLERAGLMEQQTNLLLRRLADLLQQ